MVSALLVPLAIPAKAADLTLAWDANSESDLAGYRIYYKTGTSGAPYDGIGIDQGNSGIDITLDDLTDFNNPIITLTGLTRGVVYYLVITAYDEQGNESGYSNEVGYCIAASDRDGDNVTDAEDAFPDDSSEWADYDGDGVGNNADPDDDNDGYFDAEDAFPNDPSEWADENGVPFEMIESSYDFSREATETLKTRIESFIKICAR